MYSNCIWFTLLFIVYKNYRIKKFRRKNSMQRVQFFKILRSILVVISTPHKSLMCYAGILVFLVSFVTFFWSIWSRTKLMDLYRQVFRPRFFWYPRKRERMKRFCFLDIKLFPSCEHQVAFWNLYWQRITFICDFVIKIYKIRTSWVVL